MNNQTFFTAREAAQYLRIAEGTLRHYRSDGIGPKYYKGKGLRSRIRYLKEDLDAWIMDSGLDCYESKKVAS